MFNNIIFKLIQKYPHKIKWDVLLGNPCIPVEFIENCLNRHSIVDWNYISKNVNLTPKFIKKHKDKLCWSYLVKNPCFTMNLIKKYILCNDIDDEREPFILPNWESLSQNINLTSEFIIKHKDDLDWEYVVENPCFTMELIETFMTDDQLRLKIDRCGLANNPNLTEEFINKYLNDSNSPVKLSWQKISTNKNLSQNFIRSNINHLHSLWLSRNSNLTFEFLMEFIEIKNIEWQYLSFNQYLTNDMIDKLIQSNDIVIDWSWLSANSAFNQKMISKYHDRIIWNWFSMNPHATLKLIEENIDRIDWYCLSMNEFNWDQRIIDQNKKILADKLKIELSQEIEKRNKNRIHTE